MEQHEQIAWMLRSFIEGEALVSNGDRAGLESRLKVGV
jgi:starvation-inducible DNA-binding protein